MKKVLASLAGFVLMVAPLFAESNETVRKAPELAFSIPAQGQKLLSQYRGKVVALEFIFTTCPHCQAATKVMNKLQQDYGSRGLQVIDVAVNPNADLLVENFAKDFHTNFPVGWTPSTEMLSFMGFNMAARYVVPQLVLIDRNGYIHYQTPAVENEHWDSLMKEDAIRQHIEQLLSLGKTSASATHSNSAKSSRVAMARNRS